MSKDGAQQVLVVFTRRAACNARQFGARHKDVDFLVQQRSIPALMQYHQNGQAAFHVFSTAFGRGENVVEPLHFRAAFVNLGLGQRQCTKDGGSATETLQRTLTTRPHLALSWIGAVLGQDQANVCKIVFRSIHEQANRFTVLFRHEIWIGVMFQQDANHVGRMHRLGMARKDHGIHNAAG